ncbi:MAG: tryptophan 7-halogenase [Gemmatimonadota bacterium]
MSEHDALVVGGGPAGAAAFQLLRQRGLDVCWVPGPRRAHDSLTLSLPPSCASLFHRAGLGAVWERTDWHPTTGNAVHWAGVTRGEPFAAGTSGRICEAGPLEDALREAAGTAPGRIQPGRALRIESEGERMAVRIEGCSEPLRTHWVLDCTGRSGLAVRSGLAKRESGPSTLAVSARWHSEGAWGPGAGGADTVIESQQDGWAWSVPLAPDVRDVSVMLDPRHTPRDAGSLQTLYRARLAAAPRLCELLGKAVQESAAWACDATTYWTDPVARSGLLLVGDAASALDPLTSYGVKKALASAWLAAAVVETCLADDAMTGAALDLYAERERAIPEHLGSAAAAFAADAARTHAQPFWRVRADTDRPPWAELDPDVEALRSDPAVLAAFEEIRGVPTARFAVATLQTVRRPTVVGTRIAWEDRLVTRRWPRGLRHLRGVDLLELAKLAPQHPGVPDLYERYCRTSEPVILPDFTGALSVLVAEGVLSLCPTGPGC